ncbi:hypothetical protein EDB19DRAFT_1911578 [Suillus lakei]|nr:hypothetical protein EDB19DRAFT_1911578 [Suillus lakei]
MSFCQGMCWHLWEVKACHSLETFGPRHMTETTTTLILQPALTPAHHEPQLKSPSSSCLDVNATMPSGSKTHSSSSLPSISPGSPHTAHLSLARRLWNAILRHHQSVKESTPGEIPKRTGFFVHRLHSNSHPLNDCGQNPEVVEVAAVCGFQRYVATAKPVHKPRPLAATGGTLIPAGHVQTGALLQVAAGHTNQYSQATAGPSHAPSELVTYHANHSSDSDLTIQGSCN